jgi:hypothetical protein
MLEQLFRYCCTRMGWDRHKQPNAIRDALMRIADNKKRKEKGKQKEKKENSKENFRES